MSSFPTVRPLAPWEASALLSNTGIAAGLPNDAKLDRLTYLECVVANLLLGQPPTLGLAALPPVKAVTATPGTRPDGRAVAGDFTGAHFVAFTHREDDAWDGGSGTLETRTAVEMIAEVPHLVPGDAWLVLVTNATSAPLTLRAGRGVGGVINEPIASECAMLFLVTVVSLTSVTFTPLLAGSSVPAAV